MKSHLKVVLALGLIVAGCSQPKYAAYTSIWGDYRVSVPRGWKVITDFEKNSFTQTSFIGPFDSDFFLGAPSLTIRWYKKFQPHTLSNGRLEIYSDENDFIKQMIKQVYGPDPIIYGKEQREDGGRQLIEKFSDINDIELKESGLKAKYFAVLSPTPAPKGNKWGISVDERGRAMNLRYHEYAIVPVGEGFYVLCYPATKAGHDKGMALFRALVGTFRPLTAGPGGPTIRLPARS